MLKNIVITGFSALLSLSSTVAVASNMVTVYENGTKLFYTCGDSAIKQLNVYPDCKHDKLSLHMVSRDASGTTISRTYKGNKKNYNLIMRKVQ